MNKKELWTPIKDAVPDQTKRKYFIYWNGKVSKEEIEIHFKEFSGAKYIMDLTSDSVFWNDIRVANYMYFMPDMFVIGLQYSKDKGPTFSKYYTSCLRGGIMENDFFIILNEYLPIKDLVKQQVKDEMLGMKRLINEIYGTKSFSNRKEWEDKMTMFQLGFSIGGAMMEQRCNHNKKEEKL